MKEHKNLKTKKRTILYITLAVSFALLCVLAVYFILQLLKNTPLTLSVSDGQTIALEYGVDTLPEVTASYRTTQFSKEDVYVDVEIEGEVDLTTIGTYTVTYTASNEAEAVSATHTYVVQDITAPTINLIGGTTGYYSPGYTYVENGFYATDNYDGNLTDRVVRIETPTSVSYTVTDSNGNESSVVRTLICQDVVPPSITLSGDETMLIKRGSKFTDPGYFAFDDVDGDISKNVTVTGSIDSKTYGKQYLTYTAIDSSGNTYQTQRTVVVQEFTPPELSLSGSTVFVLAGDEFIEPGYQASDDVDGDVTSDVIVSGNLDTNTAGIYTLSYTAIDSSLNTTTLSRTVYVCYPQPEEFSINPTDNVVYLTFDDGPGPYTEQLLDVLDKYNIDVTFFVTNQYPDYQDLIGDAYSRGHTIAVHTYSHVYSEIYASETAYYADLIRMMMIVEEQTNTFPTIVRFPGGSSNTISRNYRKGIMSSLAESLTSNGFLYCDWNVDSCDASSAKTSEAVATNVISAIEGRESSIVLQHDIKEYSVEAVEAIICWGITNGYTFLPLTEDTEMHHHDIVN